jgi:hypothetical protein
MTRISGHPATLLDEPHRRSQESRTDSNKYARLVFALSQLEPVPKWLEPVVGGSAGAAILVLLVFSFWFLSSSVACCCVAIHQELAVEFAAQFETQFAAAFARATAHGPRCFSIRDICHACAVGQWREHWPWREPALTR